MYITFRIKQKSHQTLTLNCILESNNNHDIVNLQSCKPFDHATVSRIQPENPSKPMVLFFSTVRTTTKCTRHKKKIIKTDSQILKLTTFSFEPDMWTNSPIRNSTVLCILMNLRVRSRIFDKMLANPSFFYNSFHHLCHYILLYIS